MKDKTVLAIGRWMPIHLGHKQFLVNLARKYGTLVVGIGSCYENGTPRNCIPAIEREKLLRTMFGSEGITNFVIVHVPDRPTFEEWFGDIARLCQLYGVTHFCTGNKEDILNVMEEKGLELGAEMINPEDDSDFPYHATDIRNAILRGETDLLDTMIPAEIKDAVLSQVAKEIRLVNEGKGQEFVPGRQTVDLVFIVRDGVRGKDHLLIGKRNDEKTDFPGYYAIPGGGIREFESPAEASVRCFEAEVGIRIEITDNSREPASAVIRNFLDMETELAFTGIYSSHDERINGTRGGGSQCFAALIEGSVDEISKVLHSEHDMVELLFVPVDEVCRIDFAYDQKRMVYNALIHLGIPFDKGEMLGEFGEDGTPTGRSVSRASAHKNGILHGAAHTYIYKKENGVLHLLLQRRSRNKDSFPGCFDVSSAGHVEFGSDFLTTALRELFEELGITAAPEDLCELFMQKICCENIFHGESFTDREINKVYALEMDVDTKSLTLQEEEVSEAVWMRADDVLEALRRGDPEFSMDRSETERAVAALEE